jgi:hypothetical protein
LVVVFFRLPFIAVLDFSPNHLSPTGFRHLPRDGGCFPSNMPAQTTAGSAKPDEQARKYPLFLPGVPSCGPVGTKNTLGFENLVFSNLRICPLSQSPWRYTGVKIWSVSGTQSSMTQSLRLRRAVAPPMSKGLTDTNITQSGHVDWQCVVRCHTINGSFARRAWYPLKPRPMSRAGLPTLHQHCPGDLP